MNTSKNNLGYNKLRKYTINPPNQKYHGRDKTERSQTHKQALNQFEAIQDAKLTQDYWDTL